MKKKVFCVLAAAVMLSLSACGKEGADSDSSDPEVVDLGDPKIIDVDLTQLSSTMVYSEVYQMMMMPEEYVGKRVRMEGEFVVYPDEAAEKNYYAVIITDATACCAQGMEFVLEGEHQYPEDYPEVGEELTVTGVFQTYEEDGLLYCHLTDAQIEEDNEIN